MGSERLGIIIPVIGQFEYTEQLVKNIKSTARSQYQILIVNNSTDPKDAYDLRALLQYGVSIIHNRENLGCSKSWNQGLGHFKNYDYVAILNNDIILSNNWDINMMEAFTFGDNIAVVFPHFWSHGELTPEAQNMLDTAPTCEPFVTGAMIAGFCFMVKKSEYGFGVGRFQDGLKYWYGDAEYWYRTKTKKKRLMAMSNVCCHHFESKTCLTLPDFSEQIVKDAELYQQITKALREEYAKVSEEENVLPVPGA